MSKKELAGLESYRRFNEKTLTSKGISADMQEILQALDASIAGKQEAILRGAAFDENDLVQSCLAVGVCWGDQLVKRFNWEWVSVRLNGEDLMAVVSPDRSLVIYPMSFVAQCLEVPDTDCAILLAYNMLDAGNISGMPAKGYLSVMDGVHRLVPKR